MNKLFCAALPWYIFVLLLLLYSALSTERIEFAYENLIFFLPLVYYDCKIYCANGRRAYCRVINNNYRPVVATKSPPSLPLSINSVRGDKSRRSVECGRMTCARQSVRFFFYDEHDVFLLLKTRVQSCRGHGPVAIGVLYSFHFYTLFLRQRCRPHRLTRLRTDRLTEYVYGPPVP